MYAPDQPLGTIDQTDGQVRLRFERRLAHPPEKVWRALTESEHLRWWMPCDIVGERRAGATIELPFWPEVAAKYDLDDTPVPGAILVWDPPHRFEWRWETDVLRWELEAIDSGTLLKLTTLVGEGDQPPAESIAAGYHTCLDHLRELLDTGASTSVAATDPTPLEARYAAVLTEAAAIPPS